jgi:hypothetical protein
VRRDRAAGVGGEICFVSMTNESGLNRHGDTAARRGGPGKPNAIG